MKIAKIKSFLSHVFYYWDAFCDIAGALALICFMLWAGCKVAWSFAHFVKTVYVDVVSGQNGTLAKLITAAVGMTIYILFCWLQEWSRKKDSANKTENV